MEKTKSKVTAYLVGLIFAFSLGAMVGAGGFAKLVKTDFDKMAKQRVEQLQEIDSLKKISVVLKDSLQIRHEVTTKETIKYYEIKPKSNSVPYLDSMFRARYN